MTDSPLPKIRNFHQVNDWLYRGGQPGAEAITALADMGIKTVVSLRWGKKVIDAERAGVESTGMSFINYRVNYWTLPAQETIEDFLTTMSDESKRPIFLHCAHGADRSGLFVAIYRMAHDGWTVEQAYAEMKEHGFHRFRIRNFKWMLWKYSRENLKK